MAIVADLIYNSTFKQCINNVPDGWQVVNAQCVSGGGVARVDAAQPMTLTYKQFDFVYVTSLPQLLTITKMGAVRLQRATQSDTTPLTPTVDLYFRLTKFYNYDTTTIIITNNTLQDLTGYAVNIQLGAHNWYAWSCSNGSDIYFVDASGNPLYYWVEYFDASKAYASIWVKVDIPASSSVTIYMKHCGSNPYQSYNDPTKVFLFFDHFTSKSSVWSWPSGWTQSGTYASYTNTGGDSRSITAALIATVGPYPTPVAVEYFAYNRCTYSAYDMGLLVDSDTDNTQYIGINVADGAYDSWYLWTSATSTTDFGEPSKCRWNRYTLVVQPTSLALIMNGVVFSTATLSTPISQVARIGMGSKGASDWDWVAVRPYASPEPTVTVVNPYEPHLIAAYVQDTPAYSNRYVWFIGRSDLPPYGYVTPSITSSGAWFFANAYVYGNYVALGVGIPWGTPISSGNYIYLTVPRGQYTIQVASYEAATPGYIQWRLLTGSTVLASQDVAQPSYVPSVSYSTTGATSFGVYLTGGISNYGLKSDAIYLLYQPQLLANPTLAISTDTASYISVSVTFRDGTAPVSQTVSSNTAQILLPSYNIDTVTVQTDANTVYYVRLLATPYIPAVDVTQQWYGQRGHQDITPQGRSLAAYDLTAFYTSPVGHQEVTPTGRQYGGYSDVLYAAEYCLNSYNKYSVQVDQPISGYAYIYDAYIGAYRRVVLVDGIGFLCSAWMIQPGPRHFAVDRQGGVYMLEVKSVEQGQQPQTYVMQLSVTSRLTVPIEWIVNLFKP